MVIRNAPKLGISLLDNYEYCAYFARTLYGGTKLKVLDYGCGKGSTVELLLKDGHDAYGCDAWYEGGDTSEAIPAAIRNRIATMDGDRIPFPDGTFDLVMSNQVLEHVADIDIVLSEMARVLRPGGTCLALFPHREVWREGHTNIPFLHWFPKGSAAQIWYATLLRKLGLGYFKDNLPPMAWAERSCRWINTWCHYRPRRQLNRAFRQHISPPRHIEADWMAKRWPTLRIIPRKLRTLISRKASGLVITAIK